MPQFLLVSKVTGCYGERQTYTTRSGIQSNIFIAKGLVICQWFERENECELLNQLNEILNEEQEDDYRQVSK